MGGKRVDTAARGGRKGLLAAAGAAVLVLTVGGVAAAVFGGGGSGNADDAAKGDSSTSASSDHSEHSDHSAGGGEAVDPVDEESSDTGADSGTDEACVDEVKAAEKAVSAAKTGIGHLKTHVGAHADWVAGEISETEKKNRYVKTKLAGPDDVKKWKAALADYEDQAGGCDGVESDCATRLTSLEATISEARMGMKHWDEHLANMAAFADGAFDSTEAQSRWDKTISTMPDMTSAFDKSMKKLDQAPACA